MTTASSDLATCRSDAFDRRMMLRAIALARQGEGWVEPNPMVGCVIVQDQEIVGEGFHNRFGGPHAEIEALTAAGARSRGGTMYVTLEPCCHQGKTPPCTDAVIKSGVQRLVLAQHDPFPQVDGGGIKQLQSTGIVVDLGICQQQAAELNAPYLKRIRTGLPWVIAKWAMTLDGKIASHSGKSYWISSEASRRVVHQLRGRVDAIVVGKQTVIADDPQLTARPPGPRTAVRVVVTTAADVPVDRQLVQTAREFPVLIAAAETAPEKSVQQLRAAGCEVWLGASDARQRLIDLLKELSVRGHTNVLVEGGATLLGSFFDLRLVDELHVFIAPKILGGADAIPAVGGQGADQLVEACSLANVTYELLDGDIYAFGRIQKE